MHDPLGEFELLVLLALHSLSTEGYGRAIQLRLWICALRAVSLGTICKTLHRLEAKGLARSHLGEPRREPGGRRRKHYMITPAGWQAVTETLKAISRFFSRSGTRVTRIDPTLPPRTECARDHD